MKQYSLIQQVGGSSMVERLLPTQEGSGSNLSKFYPMLSRDRNKGIDSGTDPFLKTRHGMRHLKIEQLQQCESNF